ncbi:phage holin family protein [Desulfosporosinus metallidurans]|uniref:Putative membrane protein n=1 Tax=Desulfosporosinus metallidurans TaxID=1888891 RepID=A0A1Q8R2T9_9FIRM|nr:phage holin family protein [Desulfosporosinus metallidurans]OLN33899.1 putative membrane protein [Desulfosporosinus metallidurans]
MFGLIGRLLINALALILMTMIVPGLQLAGLSTAIMAALVWGLVNTLVRPVFSFFTFPLQLLTLGLFTLVLNGTMLALTAKLVPGFTISSFSSAFIGALVLSIISLILTHLFK